jgi:hypothetical protein
MLTVTEYVDSVLSKIDGFKDTLQTIQSGTLPAHSQELFTRNTELVHRPGCCHKAQ